MQKERKIGILRRFALGLAVAALVAPAAQARPLDLGGETGSIATLPDGEDKGYVRDGGSTVGSYDEGGSTESIGGYDEVFAPKPVSKPVDYTVAGYPLALQIRDAQQVHGEDKANYPRRGDGIGLPKPGPHSGLVYEEPTTVAPVGGESSPSSFDWSDAFIGAGAAFGLMLLAGGAALGMRQHQRAATA